MDFTERERFLRFLALGVAEDESLYAHDRRFHPDGYHGGRCLYRARQTAGDPSDTLLAGSLRGTSSPRPRGGAAPSAPWEREYAEVIARYTNPDGSHKKGWLRAPNGKPSKLVSSFDSKEDGIRAWVQVRTPSFKKWFGDWESYSEEQSIKERLDKWVSDPAELEWAKGKTLAECEAKFGGELKPIAFLPTGFLSGFSGKALDNRIYSSKGYLLDHMANHGHSDIGATEYRLLQEMFESPDEIIKDNRQKPNGKPRDSLLFVKRFAKNRLAAVELSEEDGHIVLHKSLYNTRDRVYPNLPRVYSSGGGRSPISHAAPFEAAPGGSLSARDVNNVSNFLFPVNPASVSKIVDSNGEPMVCWHGSRDNTFDRFDKRKIHPKDGIRSFFFAPPERRDSIAGFYGEGKERPFFLNVRHPVTLDPNTQPKNLNGIDGIIRIYEEDEVWKPRYFNYRTDKEETERIKKGDILEIQVFEPNQIKSADGNNGEFSPRKETVMDSQIDLKKIAELAIAEDAAEETALEVALEYLNNEPTPPPRCRYPKVLMPSERRGASAATPAEDADPPLTDLQKHDRRFHPKGYKEGDSCKYRETLAKGDKSDEALSAAETAESRGNLSSKKHAEYLRLMQKKHPELDAMAVLAEVGKIGDKKIQADAFAWVLRGAVRLPEDLYKVEQARELATKAKVDPLSFSTPQACINDLLGKGHKVSLKPITVEELKKDPLFSDYKKLPAGVETFEVEDSREGQRRMREVIDTHWGKDANPWCLLARKEKESWERSNDREEYEKSEEWWRSQTPPEREEIAAKIFKKDASRDIIDDFVNCESIVDADGAEDYYYKNVAEPVDDLENAWDYWNHYNALPKRVAFKDGKLLAFMATDPLDEDSAFDDAAYGGGSKLAKMYPDEYEEYDKWTETEEGQEEGANFFEWLQHNYPNLATDKGLRENTHEEWWDRSDAPHKGIPLGNIPVENDPYGRWADVEVRDGNAVPVGKFQKGDDAFKDGYVSWYDNGQKEVEHKDGKLSEWYENGDIKRKTYDDMTVLFRKDGKMSMLKNFGSNPIRTPMVVSFWDNGKPASISIKLYNAFAPGGHGDANLVLRRDGTLSPESTLSPVMSEKEIRAKADALIAEAKRRFPQGGKTPVKDTSPFPEKAFQKWLEKQG